MGQRMLRVAIVGADSLAGRDLLESLYDDSFPMEEPRLFSLGEEEETLSLEEEDLRVRPLEPGALKGQDLIFVLPGARLEAAQVEEATAGGGIVLDASAERSEAPLVFPGLNDEKLDEHPDARHYALPTPLAAQLATVLLPLEAKVRVRSVEAVALLPAAGAGVDGIDELSRQTIDLLSGREPPRKVFGHRLAFNLVPLVGRMGEAGQTDEEVGTLEQAGRLLGRAIPGHLVATWVPLFHGSTLFVTVRTERPLDREAVRAAYKEEKGIAVLDDPEQQVVPMPMLAVGDARMHVGRFLPVGESLHLVSVADALRFGVAAPLVELARELFRRGRFSG